MYCNKNFSKFNLISWFFGTYYPRTSLPERAHILCKQYTIVQPGWQASNWRHFFRLSADVKRTNRVFSNVRHHVSLRPRDFCTGGLGIASSCTNKLDRTRSDEFWALWSLGFKDNWRSDAGAICVN